MFSTFPYFAPELFCFLIIQLYIFVLSPPTCWYNFFSLFWDIPFCLYCFILSRCLFSLPSFARTFWFISSSCIVYFNCVAFLFSPQHIPPFFLSLIIFVRGRKFLISISSLIFHPGFQFLFVFFSRTPILSPTHFAPAWISSFNSVMLFVEICVHDSLIFQFRFCCLSFLIYGYIVFFSDIIIFIITIFIFLVWFRLVWPCFMAYHPSWLFNAKSYLYIYQIYTIVKHILSISF